MSEEIKQKMRDLDKEIKHLQYSYYINSESLVSDIVFDTMFAQLEELEKQYPEYIDPMSAVQEPMEHLSEDFRTCKHVRPMTSIQTYLASQFKELKAWYDNIKARYSSAKFLVEPKFDGIAISLVYYNGRLLRALTRGNYLKGEIVTAVVSRIPSVPMTLKEKVRGYVEIRGEVTFKKDQLASFNASGQTKTQYVDSRSAASGIVRSVKNINPWAIEHLEFHPYEIFTDVSVPRQYDRNERMDMLRYIQAIGFDMLPPVTHVDHVELFDDIYNYYTDLENIRGNYRFDMDGIVIKVANILTCVELGNNKRVPHWAAAFKFSPEVVETTVRDIEINVGSTGMLTPVVIIEPVKVGGVIVERASVSNFAKLRKLMLKPRWKAYITRSGDTIPEVVAGDTSIEVDYAPPIYCPMCHSVLEYNEDLTSCYCRNTTTCPGQRIGRINRAFSKEHINIPGISVATLQYLYDAKLIAEPVDVYCPGMGSLYSPSVLVNMTHEALREQSILRMSQKLGISSKEAASLYDKLTQVKVVSLSTFIAALGIQDVSIERARLVAKAVKTIDGFLECTMADLMVIDGINITIATRISNYLQNKVKVDEIKLFRKLLHEITPEPSGPLVNYPLHGEIFVFTGGFDYSRRYYEERVIRLGGKINKVITKKVNYLVTGRSPTPDKILLAQKYAVPAINEDQLMARLNSLEGV